MQTVLYAVLIIMGMLGSGGIAIGATVLRNKSKLRREQEQKAVVDLVQELRNLTAALKQSDPAMVTETIGKLPLLTQGIQEMCKELCRSNDGAIKMVETFQRSIDGSSYHTGDREEDEETDAEQEVRTLIRKGESPALAEARVREKMLYKGMNR